MWVDGYVHMFGGGSMYIGKWMGGVINMWVDGTLHYGGQIDMWVGGYVCVSIGEYLCICRWVGKCV